MLLTQRCVGPNGSTVSQSNSESPDQWDAATLSGTGSAKIYNNTRSIHDNPTSMKLTMAAIATLNYVGWTSTSIGGPLSNAYVRFYAYSTANPTAQMRLATYQTGASAANSALVFATAGKLRILNAAGATLATSTTDIPLNKWVRFEYDCLGISGTTGTVNGRFFSGANLEGYTPDSGSVVTAAGAAIGGTVSGSRIGASLSTTMTSVWDSWFQDIALSDSPIGPLPFRGWGVPL